MLPVHFQTARGPRRRGSLVMRFKVTLMDFILTGGQPAGSLTGVGTMPPPVVTRPPKPPPTFPAGDSKTVHHEMKNLNALHLEPDSLRNSLPQQWRPLKPLSHAEHKPHVPAAPAATTSAAPTSGVAEFPSNDSDDDRSCPDCGRDMAPLGAGMLACTCHLSGQHTHVEDDPSEPSQFQPETMAAVPQDVPGVPVVPATPGRESQLQLPGWDPASAGLVFHGLLDMGTSGAPSAAGGGPAVAFPTTSQVEKLKAIERILETVAYADGVRINLVDQGRFESYPRSRSPSQSISYLKAPTDTNILHKEGHFRSPAVLASNTLGRLRHHQQHQPWGQEPDVDGGHVVA